MKLIQQIIEKKMELHNELLLNRNYKRAIWNFYTVFNISLAILKVEDKKQHVRNKLWKKFLMRDVDEKSFKRIKALMKKDTEIIIKALRLVVKQSEKLGIEEGEGYHKPKSGHIGVQSYELGE